jgi:hypothetical protein
VSRTVAYLGCKPAALEHAGNVAGIGKAIDRRGDEAGGRPANVQDEFEEIVEEARGQLPGQLQDKRFHVSGSGLRLSNAQIYILKMSNAQEKSLRRCKLNARSTGGLLDHAAKQLNYL